VVRRAAVVAVVFLLGALAATVHADPALAYVDAITTADDWAVVDSWLQTQGVPAELGTDATTVTRWSRMRNAAGVGLGLDGMTAAAGVNFPTIAVVAGGLAFGWEIGHASGLSGWARGKLLGLGTAAYGGTITAANWKPYTCAVVNDWNPCAGRYAAGERLWELDATTGDPCNATDRATTSWESAWNIDFSCNEANNTIKLAWLQNFITTTPNAWASTGDCTGSASTNDCYGVFTGPKELLGGAAYTELRAYNSTTDAQNKTAGLLAVPRPASIDYGSAAADAVEAAIENDDVLGPKVGTILHPATGGGTESETIALPQPMLNETAAQYRTRLRAAGFLGTITLSENAGVDILPEFGPLVVTSITVGVDTYPLLDPWPSPPPTLAVPGTTTTITVEHNPDTAPAPGPGDPGSAEDPPPGNAPPPGGGGIGPGDCACPPPDFSTITGIDYGTKFPFGVLALVTGVLGTTLYAAPAAPEFDLVVNDGEIGGHAIPGGGHYVVNLDVADSYVAVIRTLLSWCIWIGGLWWFGSRWFGFNATGDVGARRWTRRITTWLLQGIYDILAQLVCWIMTALVSVLNLVLATLGGLLVVLIDLLPDMPALPALPSEVTTAAGWVNWIFPVSTVASFFTFILGAWLLWQAVAIAMRWAKAMGDDS
jgi:hypothetical protein